MPEAKNNPNGRRYLIGFSIVGCLLLILFFAFINFTTGTHFPWFIFPSFAVLWWPLITIFHDRRSINILALIGSVVIIASLTITNLIVTPSNIWFHYIIFAVIWWPLSKFFTKPGAVKGYSVAGAAVTIIFLTLTNYLESPAYLWAPLTYFPVLMWPAGTLLGNRLGKLSTAVCGCLTGILYYVAMNILLFPGFPWAIFPVYALLWWPLAIAFTRRRHFLLFSVTGTFISAVFFIAVNIITTPHSIWAVYPIFALAWWPISMYYFSYRRQKINAEIM